MLNFSKIVEITYAIYQGLPKKRLCKEYVTRKVNNAQWLICAEILPLHIPPPSPPKK